MFPCEVEDERWKAKREKLQCMKCADGKNERKWFKINWVRLQLHFTFIRLSNPLFSIKFNGFFNSLVHIYAHDDGSGRKELHVNVNIN